MDDFNNEKLNEDAMKATVGNVGPVATGVYVDKDFQNYRS